MRIDTKSDEEKEKELEKATELHGTVEVDAGKRRKDE